ncbi:MAG: hypothetical protein HPY52_10880 [Firmicutes bacterium]|nr:hypothetical protein [Bacillota bacterium]
MSNPLTRRSGLTAVPHRELNPHVNMIVHPCNPAYPVDMEELVRAGAHFGVIIELNARSFSPLMTGKRDSRELCISYSRPLPPFGWKDFEIESRTFLFDTPFNIRHGCGPFSSLLIDYPEVST